MVVSEGVTRPIPFIQAAGAWGPLWRLAPPASRQSWQPPLACLRPQCGIGHIVVRASNLWHQNFGVETIVIMTTMMIIRMRMRITMLSTMRRRRMMRMVVKLPTKKQDLTYPTHFALKKILDARTTDQHKRKLRSCAAGRSQLARQRSMLTCWLSACGSGWKAEPSFLMTTGFQMT